jgi:hypothetical protein
MMPVLEKNAVLRGQDILLVVVDHAENIVAVLSSLPKPSTVDAVFAAALVLGRDHFGGDVGDVDRALGDEVDDAADGVRAVDGRGAVAQHFDAFQGGDGNDVEVDAGAVIRMVGDAPAVEQHEGLVAAQAAQVGAGLAARGQAAGVAADGVAAAHAGEFEGILLSTSWAVVRPCLAKSSALKMERVAVSETRRLMEEPVTSTRCIGRVAGFGPVPAG